MKYFQCTVTSAESQIYSGDVSMIIATSVNGDLGILAGHAPLLAQLAPGPLSLKKANDEEEVLYISGGFLEVQPNQVNILADTAMREQNLSEQQIEQARQQALNVVTGKDKSMDYAEAAQYLAQATAQLRTIKEIRKSLK